MYVGVLLACAVTSRPTFSIMTKYIRLSFLFSFFEIKTNAQIGVLSCGGTAGRDEFIKGYWLAEASDLVTNNEDLFL